MTEDSLDDSLATCVNNFLNLGHSLMMGKDTSTSRRSENTETRCFNAHLGVQQPTAIAAVWSLVVVQGRIGEGISDYVNSKKKHLIWTLLFIKSYQTFDVIACQVGTDEKIVQKWVWYIIAAVSDLADMIVSL
jgi:hypothetical protein